MNNLLGQQHGLSPVQALRRIDAILRDGGMKAASRLAAVAVVLHANRTTGLAWPGQRRLREMYHVGGRALREALAVPAAGDPGPVGAAIRAGHLLPAGCGPRCVQRFRVPLVDPIADESSAPTPGALDESSAPTVGALDGGQRAPLDAQRAPLDRQRAHGGRITSAVELAQLNWRGGDDPPPSVRAQIEETTGNDEQVRILCQAYLARTVRAVGLDEIEGHVAEALRNGLAAEVLADYFDVTPHVTAFPRELAGRAKACRQEQRQAAFRRRLHEIQKGGLVEARRIGDDGKEAIGRVRFADPDADPPGLVIEIDRTSPTPTREERMGDLQAIISAAAQVSPRCPTEVNARAELARIEAGGEPAPPEPEVERIDVTRPEDLAGWVFRPAEPILPGLLDQAGPDAKQGNDAPPAAAVSATAREGVRP